MIRSHWKICREEKGQSLVEFAIILPILLVLILGIIQFGMIFSGYITVVSAAREGARDAIVGVSNDNVKQKVKNTIMSSVFLYEIDNDDDITLQEIVLIDNGENHTMIEVKVNANAKIIVPITGITGNQFPLSSTAQMRKESGIESP